MCDLYKNKINIEKCHRPRFSVSSTIARTRNRKKRILKLWQSIHFLGSFGGTKAFLRELRKIPELADVSQKEVEDAVHGNLVYQMHRVHQYRKDQARPVTSWGVTLQVREPAL